MNELWVRTERPKWGPKNVYQEIVRISDDMT